MENILCTRCIPTVISSCQKNNTEDIKQTNTWLNIEESPAFNDLVSIVLIGEVLVAGYNLCYAEQDSYLFDRCSEHVIGLSVPFSNPISGLLSYNDDLYITSTESGIYYSNDLGKSWVEKSNGLPLMKLNLENLVRGSNGLYICDSGIYFSAYKENIWVDRSVPDMLYARTLVAIENTLIVSCNTKSNPEYRLFESVDNGLNWAAKEFAGIPNECISNLYALIIFCLQVSVRIIRLQCMCQKTKE